MTDLERAFAMESAGEGSFVARVPDGWQQGRGAFGGLVLGVMLSAMEAKEEDPARRTRTFAGDICGPVQPGPVDLRVSVLRRGGNQTNVRADLLQGGAIQATAVAVLSSTRTVDLPAIGPPPPSPPPWEQVEVLPVQAPFGPVFAVNYEFRGLPPLPLSGAGPGAAGFIREKEPPARVTAPVLVARLDAFYPTLLPAMDHFRPVATISFTAEILADPAKLDPAMPLHHRARAVHLREGFLLEERELWAGAELVAMNQQTFAVLG